jgi:hypothetical protein
MAISNSANQCASASTNLLARANFDSLMWPQHGAKRVTTATTNPRGSPAIRAERCKEELASLPVAGLLFSTLSAADRPHSCASLAASPARHLPQKLSAADDQLDTATPAPTSASLTPPSPPLAGESGVGIANRERWRSLLAGGAGKRQATSAATPGRSQEPVQSGVIPRPADICGRT